MIDGKLNLPLMIIFFMIDVEWNKVLEWRNYVKVELRYGKMIFVVILKEVDLRFFL